MGVLSIWVIVPVGVLSAAAILAVKYGLPQDTTSSRMSDDVRAAARTVNARPDLWVAVMRASIIVSVVALAVAYIRY